MPRWLIPALIIAVTAALIASAIWVRGTGGDPSPTAAGPADAGAATPMPREEVPAATALAAPEVDGLERRDPEDPLAEGPVDAPVVLVVFSDYQCPYCARWNQETLPTLREYVEAGTLRIEWREVNVYGPASERAARAAYAAALQGGLTPYHEALFAGGQKASPEELTDEALIGLAERQGLDVTQFTADMTAPATIEAVAENQRLGEDAGALTTPSFVLDGEVLVGAQPTEVFTDLVDEKLAEAGS